MDTPTTYPRINIYLDDPELRAQIKIAAARQGVTVSNYCLEAIKHRLSTDDVSPLSEAEGSPSSASRQAAAQALDHLRRKTGPIGVPVSELIVEGRQR
jgi:hypothetical protein